IVLWASAAISKAERINSLSPNLSLGLRARRRARYSRRINFFSWSSVRLYFGIAATVSISIHYEFTKKSPSFASPCRKGHTVAGVAKLADALDLGSSGAIH